MNTGTSASQQQNLSLQKLVSQLGSGHKKSQHLHNQRPRRTKQQHKALTATEQVEEPSCPPDDVFLEDSRPQQVDQMRHH